jgi:hypothetical protein
MMRDAVARRRMVVLVFARRRASIAQHKSDTPVHRREHESRRNKHTQEEHPKDEPCRPSWLPDVAHPFHRGA